MSDYSSQSLDAPPPKRLLTVKRLIFIMLTAALIPVAYAGWQELYTRFLERNPPYISPTWVPRGIGIAPESIELTVADYDAGLSAIVVRARQRRGTTELLKQDLSGKREEQIRIPFHGRNSEFEEGTVEIIVRVFDQSFWSNRTERVFPLRVDYRKPHIEVLSRQHNAVQGGSQLLFYKAFDESLAVSGVKVGQKRFFGFSAKGFDKDFRDQPSVHMVIYSVGMDQDLNGLPLKVFAEDEVGNAESVSFYNKIKPRSSRAVQVELPEAFMRKQVSETAEQSLPDLKRQLAREGKTFEFKSPSGSKERLVETFKLVNESLRSVSENQLSKFWQKERLSRVWDGPFLKLPGTVQTSFGLDQTFVFEGQNVGEDLSDGYEFIERRPDVEVLAVNDGIIKAAEANLGTYGTVVVVDHGLGLHSVYGYLGRVEVRPGEEVKRGQVIGYVGTSGLGRAPGFLYQLRIQGEPVDVREWWDKQWYYGHIIQKTNRVKGGLGIEVYRAFE